MADPSPNQYHRIEARGPQSQNKGPEQKWSEETWSETILKHKDMQTPQTKLQKRINNFLANATAQEQIELEQSHQQLQILIEEAKTARKTKGDEETNASFKAKVRNGWNSVSEKAYRYSQILDPLLASAPTYVSLVYGGIKIILVAQTNHQELKEKLELHLERITSRFEIIDHLTAYIPTKELVDKVASAYSLFTKLLDKAVKYYSQSRLKSYFKSLASPWGRFQDLVDVIGETFVDIKDIAQLHGLLAGRVTLKVGQQTLSLVKDQQKRADNQDAKLERILSQLTSISIQFTKSEDVNETASLVRQQVDEKRDKPTLEKKAAEQTGEGYSVLDQLGGLFADLKNYKEETQRRKVAIEEIPDMRNHRSAQRNLLRSEKVLSWIECETSRLLWVEGNNVLRRSEFNACFAIPLLVMGESSYESTLVLRHFCGGTGMARKPSTLLQALLYQIIERNPSILEKKKDTLTQEKTSTVQGLWSLFVECLENVNAQCTFIIIDAFDNLEAAEPGADEKDSLISQLDSLVKDKTKFVKVLLTASLAQPLATLPDEYQALTRFHSRQQPGGLHRSLSMAAAEDQAQLMSHQIIEIQERRCKAVSFHELPFLYPSGTLIYEKDDDHWRAFIVAELSGMDRQPSGYLTPLRIRSWSVDHNGKYFAKKYHNLTVSQFSGQQAITSLKFTPVGYLPDETTVRKALADRGRWYWELGSKVNYKQFEGKHGPVRVVIDQQMRPRGESPQEQGDQFLETPAENIKPQALMTCPPDIAVYLLSELRWSTMDIDKIQDLVVDKYRGWDRVLIDRSSKQILQILVRGRALAEENYTGSALVTNGTTVLLHGAPGTGKTFAVECLAESFKKPLLRLTHGKLGGAIQEMAKNLEEFFQLSDRWGCIMLLDDVDVFLSKRANDLTQNIMGTLFMQLTETHNGLLFLTTNRVGMFDGASLSRIPVKLYFNPLTEEQIRQVTKLSLNRIQDRLENSGVYCFIETDGILQCVLRMSRDSARMNMMSSGREIVNLCETALILAQHDAEQERGRGKWIDLSLLARHFTPFAEASHEFENYIDTVVKQSRDQDDLRFLGESLDHEPSQASSLLTGLGSSELERGEQERSEFRR
ncbi:hypothetical protein BJY00DRAFT_280250 [Aspergillus carlsbadensis]|nr:hypothetical protein BJY00DRAFT_280250 [Aspergillus carlsbadensis]